MSWERVCSFLTQFQAHHRCNTTLQAHLRPLAKCVPIDQSAYAQICAQLEYHIQFYQKPSTLLLVIGSGRIYEHVSRRDTVEVASVSQRLVCQYDLPQGFDDITIYHGELAHKFEREHCSLRPLMPSLGILSAYCKSGYFTSEIQREQDLHESRSTTTRFIPFCHLA